MDKNDQRARKHQLSIVGQQSHWLKTLITSCNRSKTILVAAQSDQTICWLWSKIKKQTHVQLDNGKEAMSRILSLL